MDPGISFYCSNRKGYLPQPPREWSRVQNSCSVITPTDDTGLFQVPYSKKVLPYSEIGPTLAMISKGNVLQYKKNSSNLTQWQKYSKIAKGQWVNRTKTWATQSDRGYTNPNNMNLIRVGGVNVTLNGTATTLPVTCPKPGTIVYPVLPANSGGGGGEPNPVLPPPPIAPVDGGNVIPITPVPVPEPVVIQDFGNLICGTYENVCTGERTPIILLDNCHPTTDSDVPGPIEELCWNDGNPTWYPRQRYIMTNSDNKWPINAVLGSADKFTAPALSASVLCNVITLSWNLDLFYSIYNIFQDEYTLPIGVVSGTTNTFTINIDEIGTYSFYIKGVNGNVRSEASNTVSVSISQTPAPTNLTYTLACNVATLNWNAPLPCNLIYQVYENGVLIDTTTQQTLSINLDAVGTYDFYVIALLGSIESVPSNTVSVSISQTPAPTNLTTNIINICSSATLSWIAPLPCNLTYQVYDNITSTLIGTTTSTSLPVTLANCRIYSFYVVAVLGTISSAPSNPVSAEGLVTYSITSLVNTNYNIYSNNGYTGIVFDNSTAFTTGTAVINFCKNVNNASILIVGGGGGGGAGDIDPPSPTVGVNSAGGGGGGGSITYLTGQTISGSTNINLTIGFGGAGKSPGNGGFGNLTGQSGATSIFSSYTAGGGGGGRGDGSTTVGGGDGGSPSSGYGGGGGGGGASIASPSGNSTKGGPGGIGSLGNGSSGGDVDSIFTPTTGGTGGVNALTSVLLPFTPVPVALMLGGGGGGGGTVSGGSAGNGTGGLGGTNIGPSPGASASSGILNTAYGGGGGGSGINATSAQAVGGNGGNGTVIIWWPTC